jgi:hypothetical protein
LIQEISGDLPRTGKTYHSDGLKIQVLQVSHKQLILARVGRQRKK